MYGTYRPKVSIAEVLSPSDEESDEEYPEYVPKNALDAALNKFLMDVTAAAERKPGKQYHTHIYI